MVFGSSIALQRCWAYLTGELWKVSKLYSKIVALFLYSVALQKVKIKTLKRKEYNEYDQ